MRRALLTVGIPSPALDVGYDFTGITPTLNAGFALHWCDANPLNANGTITSVRANCLVGGADVAFALLDPAGAPTYTVRSVSATLVSVAGEHTYAVSLAGQAGDLLAVWQNTSSTSNPRITATATGVTGYHNTTTAKPTAGSTRAGLGATSGRAIFIYGTG